MVFITFFTGAISPKCHCKVCVEGVGSNVRQSDSLTLSDTQQSDSVRQCAIMSPHPQLSDSSRQSNSPSDSSLTVISHQTRFRT